MKPTDQTVKLRLVLLTAALGMLGFILEIGPVGGVFALINKGLRITTALSYELQALGFLAYLALAASAFVGLHPTEDEPTPKEKPPGEPALKSANESEVAGEQVRVRPDLHQMRMIFSALGGYALLKAVSLTLMTRFGLHAAQQLQLFNFGFFFTALGWLLLWQFLRWYAQRRRWIRLQAELVGADVNKVVAVIIMLKPLIFLVNLVRGEGSNGLVTFTSLLIYLAVAGIAVLVWLARPLTLRRTLIGISLCGGVILLLTIVLAVLELYVTGA